MEPEKPNDPSGADNLELVFEDVTTALVKPAEIVTETKPGGATAPWLILAGIAAAIVGITLGLAFPRAGSSARAEATPAAAAPTPSPAPAAPEMESTPPPTWTGARRTSWARDGSKTIVFSLTATRDLPVWMAHARPALVVRCLYRTTEAFVVLDTSTKYEDDADRRTVSIQWDESPVTTQYWGVSESGRELFAPSGVEFVQRAATAHALRFGFTPFNASPVTAEFAVAGFDKLAPLIANTCGWRLPATPVKN